MAGLLKLLDASGRVDIAVDCAQISLLYRNGNETTVGLRRGGAHKILVPPEAFEQIFQCMVAAKAETGRKGGAGQGKTLVDDFSPIE